MYAIYKVNLDNDTSLGRVYGSLESQTLVYLTTNERQALEFFTDTEILTREESEDIFLGNIPPQAIYDKYYYYIEKVE